MSKCSDCGVTGEINGCGSDALFDRRDAPAGYVFCFGCNNARAEKSAYRY